MKKLYQRPESHFVDVSTERPMSGLAEMSDEELLNELRASGYFENKVCYRASEHFLAREIAGETVLVPVGEQVQRLNGFATFSETGQFLWDILAQKKCTKADLELALAKEYQRPKEEIQKDVTYYLEKMLKNGFIEQCR